MSSDAEPANGAGEPEPSKHEQIASLYERVFDLEPTDRQALYETEQIPRRLRGAVEALLESEYEEMFDEERAGQPMHALLEGTQRSQIRPGTRFGDYEIVREIAQGGMGRVFEARQVSLGRQVALKVILSSGFASEQELQRFRLEAESIARLDHPGIVPVYEVGEWEGERYLSMAFVGGGSLADLEVPLAPERAAELVEQIAEAIHFAHSRNIVHRDLKPANVLLTETMSPRVSDFGLAKDLTEGSEDLTHAGSILGTPGFLAPEQARGDVSAVGPAADVYGLGAVLFFLLTGRAPIRGENLVDTMHRVLHEDAPSARKLNDAVPLDLSSICAQCLQKDPADRYGSARALADDLRRFLDGEPTQARPIGTLPRFWKWARRHPATALASAAAVAALLAGAVVSTWLGLLATERAETVAQQNTTLKETNAQLEEARKKALDAQEIAESSKDDMQAFSRFLIEDVISTARDKGVQGGLGRDVTMRSALRAAVDKLGERFAGRPIPEALACHDLGVTLRTAGDFEVAESLLRRAVEIRERELGETHPDTLDSMSSLAACLSHLGRVDESHQLTMEIARRDSNEEWVPEQFSRWSIADSLRQKGDLDQAIAMFSELAKETSEAPESTWHQIISASLGQVHVMRQEWAIALPLLRTARARLIQDEDRIRAFGYDAALGVGICLTRLDRPEEALPYFDEALREFVEIYTERSSQVRRALRELAEAQTRLGDMPAYCETIERLIAGWPEDERDTPTYFEWNQRVAGRYWQLGRHDECLKFGQRALEDRKRREPDSSSRHSLQSILADAARNSNQPELAAELGLDGYRALIESVSDAPFREQARSGYATSLAPVLFQLGRHEDALAHQRLVLQARTQGDTTEKEDGPTADQRVQLAISQFRTGDADATLETIETGLPKIDFPRDTPLAAMLQAARGRALLELGELGKARASIQVAQSILEPYLSEMRVSYARFHVEGLLQLAELDEDEQSVTKWRQWLEDR